MKYTGWYSRELLLFLMFLAIAGGASVFFFFLSSRDMKSAQDGYVWSLEVNSTLDRIAEEAAYAARIEHPFEGDSQEFWFRRPSLGNMLEPSLVQHGLVFGEGQLDYVCRTASETTKSRSFRGIDNPLLRNVKKGSFTRRSPNLLSISVTLQPPGAADEAQTFERRIFLRGR